MTRTRLLLAAVLTVATVLGVVALAIGQSFMFPTDQANPTAMRGCVIRFDTLSATGNSVVPRIHDNASHYCVGVASVKADWSSGSGAGNLVITHTESLPVVSIAISPDETLTERGISCGASGGLGETRIACYDRAGAYVPAHSKAKLYGPYANLWITWTMWDEPE